MPLPPLPYVTQSANVACTFAPPTLSIAAGSGPVTDTLTIDTGASHAMLLSPRNPGGTAAIYAAMAFWLPGALAAFAVTPLVEGVISLSLGARP